MKVKVLLTFVAAFFVANVCFIQAWEADAWSGCRACYGEKSRCKRPVCKQKTCCYGATSVYDERQQAGVPYYECGVGYHLGRLSYYSCGCNSCDCFVYLGDW